MKTSTILLLAIAMTFGFIQRSVDAQIAQQQQGQNQVAFGNVNQGQLFAAQFQSGQLAKLMLANFDRDGDGMLNAVELQAAMTAFLVRMYANAGLLQMQQFGGQGIQQPAAVFQNGWAGDLGLGQFPAAANQGGGQQALGFQGRRGMPAGEQQQGGRGRGR